MKHNDHLPFLKSRLRAGVFVLAVAAVPLGNAATVWTGPNITWTKSVATPSDTVLAGVVVLTRDSSEVLYNTAAGEFGADGFGGSSPHDTTWAFGTIDNYSTLTNYQSLQWYHDNQAGGNMSQFITNKPMVMHIVSQDIYLSVKFITWGHGQTLNAGAVSYVRSTSSGGGGNPPTVSISAPSDGASYDAPASVGLTANASVSGGTVTNVEYFAGTTSLGSATVSPFNVTGNIPNPGFYAFTAVATAGGLSTTSSPPINITVVARPTAIITSPTNGATFSAPADVGITANATVLGGGTVTNVSFFNNTTLLGSAQSTPFTITASNLAAGPYTLTAVATAAGISGTSSVVNITIVSPPAFLITGPGISNGLFSFSYNADAGKSYVIQTSSNLVDWVSLVTNVAAGSSVPFSDPVTTAPAHYYRVGRLPSP